MKMMKHFYSTLIDINEIVAGLSAYELSEGERLELELLAYSTVHCVIIDAILIALPQKEHQVFMNNLRLDKHTKTRRHLKTHLPDFEAVILRSYSEAKNLLLEDL